jgi:hypothetical protein
VDDGCTAAFHPHAMLAADGIGTAPTPFEVVQRAAWQVNHKPMGLPASPRASREEEFDTLSRPRWGNGK